MNVSQRIHNDTYAPGIATYGIPGKPGEQGLPGASMFFTDFDVTKPNDLKSFAAKITSRMLPLKNEEIVLDRKYINNDTFVTTNGNIYLLFDINTLSLDCNNGTDTANLQYNKYFKQIGKFSNTNIFPAGQSGQITAKKLLIGDDVNSNSLLTINKSNANNQQINFIDLKGFFGSAADINLNIVYDNTLKGFVFKSKYPIVFDSNVFVNSNSATQPTQINQYSPVLTNNKSITKFVGLCNELSYSLDASIYRYSVDDTSALYYGSVYNITLNETENNIIQRIDDYYNQADKLLIHFQNKDFQDFQFYRKDEKTYYFKQDYNIVKLNDIITKIAYTDLKNIQVSLIDNTEVYLKKADYSLSGYNFIKT